MADQKMRLIVMPGAEAGVYTNQLNLNFSKDEFHVQCAQIAPALIPEQETVQVVRARLMMAPSTFKDFVRVCNEMLAKYEHVHGPIGSPARVVMFDAGKSS